MTKPLQYESRIHRAVRKMIAQKMHVGKAFVRHDGKMVYPVSGYLLTTEQILELDRKNSGLSYQVHMFLSASRAAFTV